MEKKEFIINLFASNQITELIESGWEFTLHYGDHKSYNNDLNGKSWEADFTRMIGNKCDNYECGYGINPEDAINIAYYNIKNNIKYNHIRNK